MYICLKRNLNAHTRRRNVGEKKCLPPDFYQKNCLNGINATEIRCKNSSNSSLAHKIFFPQAYEKKKHAQPLLQR